MAEDDYMSDDILLGVTEEPVGIAKSRAHQRQLKIHARFEESRTIEKPKRQTLAEKEKERRDEALAKPIGQESKGFALLAKMGFKPGMSLGKKRETDGEEKKHLKEPINIEIKVNRKGLGHEVQEDNERTERVQAVMKRMKEQAAQHEELIVDYKKRKMMMSNVKGILADIYTSRKVCEELDCRSGKKLPAVSWFWRSYRVKVEDNIEGPGSSKYGYKVAEEEEEEKFKYSNGLDAPPDLDFNAMEIEDLEKRLTDITKFLREYHIYCIWCGTQYSTETELSSNCAGDSRTAHDDGIELIGC